MTPAQLAQLVSDVADGVRILRTRDGVNVTDAQCLDRARNIVSGLISNFRIEAMPSAEAGIVDCSCSSTRQPCPVDCGITAQGMTGLRCKRWDISGAPQKLAEQPAVTDDDFNFETRIS